MIICIKKVQVICDKCHDETVILRTWQEAKKLGWTVPIDGAFQWCPQCAKLEQERIGTEIKIAQIAKTCPLVNG